MKHSHKGKSKPLSRLEDSLTYSNIWLWACSLIAKQKLHAYTLNEKIEEKYGFRPGRIMTYVVLYKLENEGLVRSVVAKRRRYYELTQKGKKELACAKQMLKAASQSL